MVEGIQGNDAISITNSRAGLLIFRLGLRLKLRKGDALLWLGCQWFQGKHDRGVSGASSILGTYKGQPVILVFIIFGNAHIMIICGCSSVRDDQDRIGQRFMWLWGIGRIELNRDFLILVVFVEPDISMLGSEKF